jgi:hypothetical protein
MSALQRMVKAAAALKATTFDVPFSMSNLLFFMKMFVG